MAVLALGFAGASLASSMAGSATAVVAFGMTASSIGMAVGATVGGIIDSMFTMPMLMGRPDIGGPKLRDLSVQTGSEGSPINRCFGPEAVATGVVIWAPRLDYERVSSSSGGKGGGGQSYYRYLADFAVLVCRNETSRIRKIWSEGKLIYDEGENVGNVESLISDEISVSVVGDKVLFESPVGGPNLNAVFGSGNPFQTSGFANSGNNRTDWRVVRSSERSDGTTYVECYAEIGATAETAGATVTLTQEGAQAAPLYADVVVYNGTSTQGIDPLIEEHEGVGNVSAWRGDTYVRFRDFNLQNSGNRLPNLKFLVEEQTSRTTASVIADILEMFGLTSSDYDVSAVTGEIRGYTISGPTSGPAMLEPLMNTYNVGVRESNGKLVFYMRASPTVIDVDADDLAAHEENEEYDRPVIITDSSSRTLPREVTVTFIEPALDWQEASQSHRRQIYIVDSTSPISLPFVLTAGEAQAVAQRLLYSGWSERRKLAGSLPPSYIHVEEGDHLRVPVMGRYLETRVDGMTRGYNLRVEIDGTVVQSQANTTFTQADDPNTDLPGVATLPICDAVLLDLPPISDVDVSRSGFYYAVVSMNPDSSFVGAAYKTSSDGLNYTDVANVPSAAQGGFASTALGNGKRGIWDRLNTVDIDLYSGTLSSTTEDEVLLGANWAVLGDEIIAFKTATHLGDTRWRLSHLLRGLRGTESATNSHAAGDSFVLVRDLLFAPRTFATLGNTYAIAVPAGGFDVDSVPTERALGGRTVMPFAPCHVRASTLSSGDIVISWQRRTRSPINACSGTLSPLNEDVQQFVVELRTGSLTLLRVGSSLTETFTYTASQQSTDGHTPGDPLVIRVSQLGNYGEGPYQELTYDA